MGLFKFRFDKYRFLAGVVALAQLAFGFVISPSVSYDYGLAVGYAIGTLIPALLISLVIFKVIGRPETGGFPKVFFWTACVCLIGQALGLYYEYAAAAAGVKV